MESEWARPYWEPGGGEAFVYIAVFGEMPSWWEIGGKTCRFVRGLKYSLISLLAGWWGIPGGPILTVISIIRNCRGGVEVTATVLAVLRGTAIAGDGY